MLFCSAPRQTDTVHRTNAPVVPSAPIDAPRAAIRNPGLASATTKPSHHVIALRSCRSSTTAVATVALLSRVGQMCPFVRQVGLLPAVPDAVNRQSVRWTGPTGSGRTCPGLDLFVQP